MSASGEGRSVEAEIADCCRAICWTTEPDIAMRNWSRLRQLMAAKAEAERTQFMREAGGAREPSGASVMASARDAADGRDGAASVKPA